MEDGAYFFIEDGEAADRQSVGGLLVHNAKCGNAILFYCMEYDQFWRQIKNNVFLGELEFKKPSISPVLFSEILRCEFNDRIDGIAKIVKGRVEAVIKLE